MGKKIVEKPSVVPSEVARAQPPAEKTDVSQPQVANGPKVLIPRDKIVVPSTRDELNALLTSAPDGCLLKDSRLCALVNGVDEQRRHMLPDWRVDLFSWAAAHLPGDVAELLDRREGRFGPFQEPRAAVAGFLAKRKNFSFCIHPLTGDALIAGTQKGHPQMFNEAHVPMDMRSRFCTGAVYLKEQRMVVNQHAGVTRLNPAESNNVVVRILREDFGVPFELGIHDQAPAVKPTDVLIERGRTPRGQMIPRWDSANPQNSVVFEGDYCYTAIPVPTKDYLHVKTAVAVSTAAGGQLFEVFNNAKLEPGSIDVATLMDGLNLNVVEPRRGKFVKAELHTLGDMTDRQVTGGSSEPLLIVRALGTGGVPQVFSKIAKALFE